MSERAPLLRQRSSAATPPSGDHAGHSPISAARGCAIIFCVFILVFLSTCNISVMTTIQSPIAIDLDATSETSWFASALLIASASVMPISGKLCQLLTERVYLLASCMVQVIGLLLSARAPNLAAFLAGRVLYGMGVAALAPVGLILIKAHAPERWHGLLFGLFNAAYTTGVACGAIIGGAMEPVVGWRAVFWSQCPVVVLFAVAVFAAIPASAVTEDGDRDEGSMLKRLSQLDFMGMFTLISCVVSLMYSLSAPQLAVTPLVTAAGFLMLFIMVEVHWARDPIVPRSILGSRATNLTGLATIGVMSARWAVLFYMPTYAIAVRQWSLSKAGLLLIPTNVGFGVGGLFVGGLHIQRSKSFYVSTLVCLVLFAGSMITLALLSVRNASLWALGLALLINGFIMGAFLNYSLAHLLHLTPLQHRVIAIPINTMFRALSGAFGAAIAGGVFVRSLQSRLTRGFHDAGLTEREQLIGQLLARPLLVQKLEGVEQRIAMDSYTASLQGLFYGGAALTMVMLAIQAGTGWLAPRQDAIPEPVEDDADAPTARM